METILSVTTFAAVIWTAWFLLPRAARQEDRFTLLCTAVSVLLTLVLWLALGAIRVT